MASSRFDLNDNEDLVLDQKPHWLMLAAPTVHVLFLVLISILAVTLLSFLPSWTLGIPLVVLLVLLLRLAFRTGRFNESHLIVTNERIVHVSGLFGRKVKEIPISQISNLSYSQRLIDRIFGVGSLEIEHSGSDGRNSFDMVRRPDRIVTAVSSQLSRRSSIPSERTYSPLDELSKLAELRRSGSITQEEYEAAKSRLLDQI